MRYAIIEGGEVTNVALAEGPLGPNWIRSDTAQTGDLWDGENFTTPPLPPPPIPHEVSKRQFKEWLIENEKIDEVEAAFAATVGLKARRLARNWWTESRTFRRDHPRVAQIGVVLGMTSGEVDAVFAAASAL